MTTAVIAENGETYLSRTSNTGASELAKSIALQICNSLTEFRKATVLNPRSKIIPDLNEIISECSTSNWDGYDAKPISQLSMDDALDFIALLPSNLPGPEVLPEPSGDIAFEWNNDNAKSFVVSFGGNKVVNYSGLFGRSKKVFGLEDFDDSIPEVIIENIRRVYR